MARGTESDVAGDPHVASSRRTGGRRSHDDPDEGSTTGTTEDGEYVGQVAGQDEGYTEETGAERRAQAEPER
jgi:hypothetical protein